MHLYILTKYLSQMILLTVLHGIAMVCIPMQCVSALGYFGYLGLTLMGVQVVYDNQCDLVATLVEI